ncbi:response regulator [Agrococcus sp. SL85]|uniref:response regulator n=1 Tax=Agrococcus sp. SL85 TaxID=2995141 RepID=UPI00226D24A4|nr:response regulator [Agrococcus sp. SL85]WAC67461.1 response regulator [Agrococcus sp. SL85]
MSAHDGARGDARDGGPVRVLVVDDDPGARALHRRFVAAAEGFAVIGTAATGEEALARCAGGVDLVLLDMRLPDISGVEVLHRLRTLAGEGPDVLVISSSRDRVTVRQAIAARVAGYLVKPFTEEVLHRRLAAYAHERRARARLEREQPLAQGEIDRLLTTGGIRVQAPARQGEPRTAPEPLPKGLAPVTLERILAALSPTALASAAEVAEASGTSRATARRYLDHLVAVGAIDLAHRYGRRGRPQVLYRLAPRPEA